MQQVWTLTANARIKNIAYDTNSENVMSKSSVARKNALGVGGNFTVFQGL